MVSGSPHTYRGPCTVIAARDLRLEVGDTGRGKHLARYVDLLDDARSSCDARSQQPKVVVAGDIPLGLHNPVAIQVPVFAPVELDSADYNHLGGGLGRVIVAY